MNIEIKNDSKYKNGDTIYKMPIRYWELENKPAKVIVDKVGETGLYGFIPSIYGTDTVWLSNNDLWYEENACRKAQIALKELYELRNSDCVKKIVDEIIERSKY